MIEGSDDKAIVAQKLAERFKSFEGRTGGETHVSLDKPLGRPRSCWHEDAVRRIDALREQGHSVSNAARIVFPEFKKYSITAEHLRTLYYVIKERERSDRERERSEGLERFCAAILDWDLEAAAEIWQLLTKEQRNEVNTRWF